MEKTIRLTGARAIAAIVVIVGLAAFQFIAQGRTLGSEAVALIKLELSSEYTRMHLPALQEAAQNPGVSTPQDVAAMISHINPDNIDIVEISARGHGDDVVVRVEVEVAGETPPDGRRVRYFMMTHSLLTGWSVEYPTSAISYYLAIL